MRSLIAAERNCQHRITVRMRAGDDILTVCPVTLNDATHADRRGAFHQSPCHDSIRSRNCVTPSSYGQDTIMHALYDLADSSLHPGLVAQVGDILAALAND